MRGLSNLPPGVTNRDIEDAVGISSEMADEMESDAAEIPSDVALSQVAELAERLSVADLEIEQLEEELKARKEVYRDVAERQLPSAMAAVGMKEFVLKDGVRINVKPYYMAKIDDENREPCHAWLDENGHADLIKHQIGVSLGRGEAELAAAVTAALTEIGVTYSDKEAVHWQTLVAFVKSMIEGGKEIPLDLFRIQIGMVAKIKRPK